MRGKILFSFYIYSTYPACFLTFKKVCLQNELSILLIPHTPIRLAQTGSSSRCFLPERCPEVLDHILSCYLFLNKDEVMSSGTILFSILSLSVVHKILSNCWVGFFCKVRCFLQGQIFLLGLQLSDLYCFFWCWIALAR